MRECDMLGWFILICQVLILGFVVIIALFPWFLGLYGILAIHGFAIETGWLERDRVIFD